MTWGDDIATRLLGSTVPAGFNPCFHMWEQPADPCPLITLQVLKDALGITDGSQDAELTRLIDVYSQAIENYCERRLCQGAQEVVYVARGHCAAPDLILPQFPVASIEHFDNSGTVYDAEALAQLVIDGQSGRVLSTAGSGWQIAQYCHIKYTAGYAEIPADIQDAMVQLVGIATSSASSGATGPLKSERVEGAVTVAYYDPRVSSSGGSPASDIGRYFNTLDHYRSERAFF